MSKNHAAPKPVLSCPILILFRRPRCVAQVSVNESFLRKTNEGGLVMDEVRPKDLAGK